MEGVVGSRLFQTDIRTKRVGQPSTCNAIVSTDEATTLVRSLSRELVETPHWQRAEIALAQSAECPGNPTILSLAEAAFRDALRIEGWLIEAGPGNNH